MRPISAILLVLMSLSASAHDTTAASDARHPRLIPGPPEQKP